MEYPFELHFRSGFAFNPSQRYLHPSIQGREAGFLGVANANDAGHAELPTAVVQLRVYDLIGRALVISESDKVSTDNAFASVIARSAGVGQNLKNLCSCDGTVIWEAQQDRVS